MRKQFIFLLLVVLSAVQLSAQESIRVVSFNVLNFPFGDMVNRQDTLALILQELQPDLLLLQELKTEAGLQQIASDSFEGMEGDFIASEFVTLQSNPGSSWPLQQGLVYNKMVFGMLEEAVILTPYRDVNAFRMYVKDEATLAGDTSFLNVFVTHLKSSQGSDNEALRNDMAEAFIAALEDYDPNIPAIFAGDFNLYYSDEAAYQTILDPDNPIVFLDPIDAPGEWTESSFGQPQLLTQSTRSSQIYGDGAGGGLDDRFDFAMLSTHLFDASEPIQYVPESYHAYGNTGLCYNQSLPACEDDDDVPPEVTWALYHMSDHLPIVFDLSVESGLDVSSARMPSEACPSLTKRGNSWQIESTHGNWRGELQVLTLDGKSLLPTAAILQTGDHIQLPNIQGMALLRWTSEGGAVCTTRMIVEK